MLLSSVNNKGDTVGSRSKTDLAYIAGFFDGDGSLMLQLKKRNDGASKWRFMATICLYQDSSHEAPLLWMSDVIGGGYLSRRNDGMTELRIQGFILVRDTLTLLFPYLRFKKDQADLMLAALDLLISNKARQLNTDHLVWLVNQLTAIQDCNYNSKTRKTKYELYEILGLTP